MMKKNNEFILRNIAGEVVLVPTGIITQNFNGLITLNSVGAFIWEHLEVAKDKEELVKLILDEYDIDEETAKRDTEAFLEMLLKFNMIDIEA